LSYLKLNNGMSKFDEEVNKILFEANFFDNIKSAARDVLGGVGGLAKTGAAALGSTFTYAKPIEDFLNKDGKNQTKDNTKKPNNIQQKNLENVKMSKFLFEVKKIKEDPYKTKDQNDFTILKNKQILSNFLQANEKLSLLDFAKEINLYSLRTINSLEKIITDTELNKFSQVDIKTMSGLQDLGANLKWLYSIHKNESYRDALTHLYNLLQSLPVV
jgi:hypothetical protein